ncbi:MAG: CotH kinase family protein [Firmicutes bacterium]|nr:CotH kinase family protein [Bacillota bacterium]
MNAARNLLFVAALLCAALAFIALPADQSFAEEREGLCINEVCADEDENGALHKENTVKGGYYDWVEIYNCSDEAVFAGDYYLTDKKKKLTKYNLPPVEIEGYGYLIIFCGDVPAVLEEGEYIADFGISKDGDETVYLTDGENILDSLDITRSKTNKTMSRYPDGGDRVSLTDATPCAPNGYTLAAPVFSHKSGFYDPFYLEMTAYDDVTIYYTTNGNKPTLKSKIYTGPIEVDNRSSEKNVYSARKDISTLYKKKLLKKYHMMKWYQKVPSKKVDKITRIRAMCVDNVTGEQSSVTSAVYFVGLAGKTAYQDINIVSIQASDSDLWNRQKGIYVLGAKYTGKENNKIVGTTNMAMRFKANYFKDREIKGRVDFFENSQAKPVHESLKMSLKGHLSRAFPQKSWNIKGKKNSFTLEIDGLDAAYKLKDPTGSLIAEGLDFEKSSYQPCQAFLNGEYWGLYYRGERLFSKSHYEDKYGVRKKTIAVIKRLELNEGKKKDLKEYKALQRYIVNHNMRVGKNYKHVKARLNINSMIDYYCMEIFAANIDWRPNWNYGVWRSRDYDNGRWNFILWDLNKYSCFEMKNKNMMAFTFSQDPYFKALYKNKNFRKKFTKRFEQLAKTNFKPKNAIAALNTVYKGGREYTKANMKRYYEGTKTIKSYDKKYRKMKRFLKVRAKICLKHIHAANKKF